ncbi:MAG: EAL domain-containing protein [Pseudomonadales bacterium]
MHHSLKARLQSVGLSLDTLPANEDEWASFINVVSMDYRAADNDRYVMERSLEIADEKIARAPRIAAANESKHVETPSNSGLSIDIEAALIDAVLLVSNEGKVLEHFNTDAVFGRLRKPSSKVFNLFEIFPDSIARRITESVANAMHEQEARTLHFRLKSNSEKKYFEARISPHDNGEFASVLVRNTTVDEFVLRQDRLIKNLFEASSEGMLLLDKSQKPLFFNNAFAKIVDQDNEELEGGIEFYNAEGEPKTAEIWQNVYFAHGWAGEVYIKQDMESIPVWLSIDTVQDSEGEITHYLALFRDISQLKRSQEHLVYYATHDQLTGLPNRDLFHTHLQAAIERAQRSSNAGALFYFDLDNFKAINDTMGHAAGDALLLEIAARLKNTFRKSELISRIGGDEFTLVVENLGSHQDAQLVAERLLQEFEKPFALEGDEFEITASMGISLFPVDGETTEALIKQADTAMYSAKDAGKNTYCFYTSNLTQTAVKKFNLEIQLRKAIERDEFHLAYQPQYDMRTGRISGAEVLLRWDNEVHGSISPAAFIPLAERTGQIEEIGQWVLENACRQLAIWNTVSPIDCLISVNVSRRQLVKPDFVDQVRSVMSNYGISGHQLEIEITESAIASSEHMAIQNLKGLQEMGCEIAIDDFGTGYSSLGNLKNFPLNRLKIDKSFVNDLGISPNADSIIAAVIALAKSLQLGVIAEGVENKEQVARLLQKGCPYAQGFYFSRPVVASEFRKLLVDERSIVE